MRNGACRRSYLGLFIWAATLVALTMTALSSESPAAPSGPPGNRGSELGGRDSRDLQELIFKLERARRKPSRMGHPVQELAAELKQLKRVLRELVNASPRGEGAQHAALLEASAARLRTLVGEVKTHSVGQSSGSQRFADVSTRIEDLGRAITDVVAAETAAERGQKASQLLAELETRGGTRVAPIAKPSSPTMRMLGEPPPSVNSDDEESGRRGTHAEGRTAR